MNKRWISLALAMVLSLSLLLTACNSASSQEMCIRDRFVCVEPWQGLPSDPGAGYELSQRPCILHLDAGDTYEYTVNIQPE